MDRKTREFFDSIINEEEYTPDPNAKVGLRELLRAMADVRNWNSLGDAVKSKLRVKDALAYIKTIARPVFVKFKEAASKISIPVFVKSKPRVEAEDTDFKTPEPEVKSEPEIKPAHKPRLVGGDAQGAPVKKKRGRPPKKTKA